MMKSQVKLIQVILIILTLTKTFGAPPPPESSPKSKLPWSEIEEEKSLQKFRSSFLNENILGFLRRCNEQDCCNINDKDQFYCPMYYDTLRQMNEALPALNITETDVKSFLANNTNQQNFCINSKKHNILSAKYYLNFKEFNAKEKLSDMTNCIYTCYELNQEGKLQPKPICLILAWMGNLTMSRTSSEISKTVNEVVDVAVPNTNLVTVKANQISSNEQLENLKKPLPEKNSVHATSSIKDGIKNVTVTDVHPEESPKITKNPNVALPSNNRINNGTIMASTEDEYTKMSDSYENNDISNTNITTEEEIKYIKQKQEEISQKDVSSGFVVNHPQADVFFEEPGSNFFSYFLFGMFICILFYVIYHNKSKILGLMFEGRRSSSKGRGGRRKHTAAYRKLDSNLEEAITSSASNRSSQVIY